MRAYGYGLSGGWQVFQAEMLRKVILSAMLRVVNYRVFLFACLFLLSPALLSAEEAVDAKTQRMFDIKIREAAVAFDKEDYATTKKLVEEGESLIPNNPATINLRGALLYKEKKYEEALVVFQALIARDANSYPGYFNMAEVWLAQKKYDQAQAGFERILDARPKDELCQYRLVLVLALKGDLDTARARAKKIQNPGQTAAYYFANAAIELIAGNQKKGLEWIQQSETFFPPESSTSLRDVLVEHDLLKK